MTAMPASRASCGEWKSTVSPLASMSPASRRTTPPRTLTSVDLPAPFSPISPRTSPERSTRLPSRNARTAPYDFAASRSSTMVSLVEIAPLSSRLTINAQKRSCQHHRCSDDADVDASAHERPERGVFDVGGEDHADVVRLGDLGQRRAVELGAVHEQDGLAGALDHRPLDLGLERVGVG